MDRNSLIEMHGLILVSNFEVITWLVSLVNANKQSLYVFPLELKLKNSINLILRNRLAIFKKYKEILKFLNIKFGEGLIFSNIFMEINLEKKLDGV